MKRVFVTLLLLGAFFLLSRPASASVGVGIGTGTIRVTENLKPGMIYELTPLSVSNTGDEPGEYGVSIEYHEKQPQLRPPRTWFLFSPGTFSLEPKKVQVVREKLDLPVDAEPGEYFCYLEAHPIQVTKQGTTSINIAAASKLYFTIVPATPWAGIYYKALSLWNLYQPYTSIAAGILILIVAILLFRKFVHIDIKLKK